MTGNEANDALEAAIKASNYWYNIVRQSTPSDDPTVLCRLVGMHCFTAGTAWRRDRDELQQFTDGNA